MTDFNNEIAQMEEEEPMLIYLALKESQERDLQQLRFTSDASGSAQEYRGLLIKRIDRIDREMQDFINEHPEYFI